MLRLQPKWVLHFGTKPALLTPLQSKWDQKAHGKFFRPTYQSAKPYIINSHILGDHVMYEDLSRRINFVEKVHLCQLNRTTPLSYQNWLKEMETTVGIVFSNATVDISRFPPPERINGVKNVRPNTAIVLTHRDNARRITRRSRISCHITSLSLFDSANLFDFFRFPSCDASVFNTRNFCSSSCKNPLQLFGLVGSTLKPNMARRK